jgi:non-specific serine/threonine protein kinase
VGDAVPPESPSATPEPVRLRSVLIERPQPGAVAPIPSRTVPKPLTSLIGREADVAAVIDLIVTQGIRLVTLTGPGGVGKTRLALRVGEALAGEFPDGVVFVPLAAIADPELVLPTIARALGLREDPARSAAEVLADALLQRRLLLVLDNFEQVRRSATHLAALLAACPDLVLLVTSRASLRIVGEQRFPVTPLALPEAVPAGAAPAIPPQVAASPAVQLFVARARAIDPGFTLDEGNAEAIAAICRRLDGLPLAIELAAPRILLLSPGELLARLRPTLPLLNEGPEDAPDRLRTMRAAIAWSHDLLSPREQALFPRLAVFVGGFTLEAAEWVAGEAEEPFLETIGILVDMSLLQRIEAAGETRFGMLETIREFGLERLAESGEADLIAARHATWCVHLAETVRRSGRLSHGGGLAALEAEHPNLRAALGWLLDHNETASALHLAAQLAEFWLHHVQNWSEGQAWLERALAGDAGAPTVARAEALVGLSMLHWPQGKYGRAIELLAEAEAVGRAVDDAGAVAYARLHQGYVALYRGEFAQAAARGEEALATCAAIPQGFSCNGALWLLSRTALARGEDDRAAEFYAHLLAAASAEGDEISIANGHVGLAILAERRGDWNHMLAHFTEAAVVCRSIGDVSFAALSIDGAAAAAAALGRLEPAVRPIAAAAALHGAVPAAPTPDPIDPQHQKKVLAVAREALAAERFAALWAAGSTLSLDETIAEALALARPVDAAGPERLSALAGLTVREHDVLRLLAAGMTDKEIAAALGIGRRTVSSHVEAIRAKLDAPSRTAAVAIAMRDRLV